MYLDIWKQICFITDRKGNIYCYDTTSVRTLYIFLTNS